LFILAFVNKITAVILLFKPNKLKTMKKVSKLCSIGLLVTLFACQKNATPPHDLSVNLAKVSRVPQTEAEKQLIQNLAKVTDILKELYRNKQNVKLVQAVLNSRTSGDKAVYLRDLIDTENSSLKQNKVLLAAISRKNLSLENFASNFNQKVAKNNDPILMSFLNKIKSSTSFKTVERSVNPNTNTYSYASPDGGQGNDITIYEPYPYEENSNEEYGSISPTLVTATADADEGIGSRPVYNLSHELIRYEEVLVNDDYCEHNPTQIVGINGIEPDIVDEGGTPVVYEPEPPILVPNLPRRILKVDIGDVQCTKQYDALISFTGNGGGSEIRFVRADAFMKTQDGQVVAENFFSPVPHNISRKDIRKERWVTFNAEWDGDWEIENLQQFFAVYEEDNRNTSETGGKLTTSYSSGATTAGNFSVGTEGNFKITYKSDDAIIYQGKLNRDVFEPLNITDVGCGKRGAWQLRNCSSPVKFTLWHKVFTGS